MCIAKSVRVRVCVWAKLIIEVRAHELSMLARVQRDQVQRVNVIVSNINNKTEKIERESERKYSMCSNSSNTLKKTSINRIHMEIAFIFHVIVPVDTFKSANPLMFRSSSILTHIIMSIAMKLEITLVVNVAFYYNYL